MLLDNQTRTAILVFANSAQEEVKYKHIANGEALFGSLTARTLTTVAKTHLPYFHFTGSKQIGNTFGERFTNAIETIFNKGFEQIITIGNDSPQLTAAHILETEKHLNDEKFVLGLSTDGGFYLMGIKRSQFCAADFKKLAWQTTRLSKELIRLVYDPKISIVRLETLFDIDTVYDIRGFISYFYKLPKTLLKVFLVILQTKKNTLSASSFLTHILHSNTYHNKGSPLLIQT